MPESNQLNQRMLAVNEALMLGLVRQHELTSLTDSLNVQLEIEIAERKLVEAALRQSEERFRALFELGPMAVYSCDASGRIENFNRRAAELWGREPVPGDPAERFCGSHKLYTPEGLPVAHEDCPMAEVLRGKIAEARDVEVLAERPDGSRIACMLNIHPLKNERGEITGAINCFYDVTERKEADRHQRILTNEIAHRGRNLLAVINSIVSRSLPGTRPLAEERDVLMQRIQAIARSQSALANGGFESASVTEIVRLELEGFSDRVTAAGPGVMLNSRVAQTFSLIVHELATNATKHGALSLPGGEVEVGWSVDGAGAEARFRFRWRERNGPVVVAPTRKGFGTVLLDQAAAQDFEAAPRIAYAREGLSYEIDAPLSALTAPTGVDAPGAS